MASCSKFIVLVRFDIELLKFLVRYFVDSYKFRTTIEKRITIVIGNLPHDYTRAHLLDLLDRHGFAGCYDAEDHTLLLPLIGAPNRVDANVNAQF